MTSLDTTESVRALTESQKDALVKLLADDDFSIYQSIRDRILSYGQPAGQWLGPHTLSGDPVLRRRAREIVSVLGRQAADNDFLAFCLRQGEDLDLEDGIWSLAKTQFSEINKEGYHAVLDSYAGDLRERIDFGAKPERIIASINHYLFTELGYAGNEQEYYDPDNSYLNRVVDRRTGNPISLCLIYLLVGRRLRLPMAGIGMPGHFLVRFQASVGEIYIDAFNRGKLLTKADCVRYLLQTDYGFQEGFLSPVTSRRILLRVCSNLHQIYSQTNQTEESARFQRYIVALAK